MAAPYTNIFGYDNTESIFGPGLTADLYGYDRREANDPNIQKLIDQGIITQNVRNYANEGGEGTMATNQVDWSRMPTLGKPGMLRPGESWIRAIPDNMYNTNAVYEDPNYGPLTANWNDKSNARDWKDMIGPAIMALVSMGAGALPVAGGLTASAAGAGAAGAAVGDAFLPGALSGLYGASSTPWWVNTGLNLAKQAGQALGASKSQQVPVPTYPGTSLPMEFQANNFGNSTGTPPSMPTGSAPVATGVAPNAYENSNYNQVIG